MRKNAKKSKKVKKKFANTKIVCIFASETKTNNDMNYRLTFEELSRVFANVAKLEKAYEAYEEADRKAKCSDTLDAYAEKTKAEKEYERLSKEIIKGWTLTEKRMQEFAGNIYRAEELINYIKNYAKELVKYMD